MAENGYWNRPSRRQVLRGGAVLGVGAVGAALIGCGSGGSGGSEAPKTGVVGTAVVATPDPNKPKRGGTFIFPSNSNLLGSTDLDPHTAPNTAVMQIWQSISRGLMQIDPQTNAPAPDFAKTVEQPDPLKINITIPDAKWDNKDPVNGRKVTAADVKYSLDRIRSNQPGFTRGSTIAALDKIDVVDDTHLTLTLKKPSVSFMYGLAFGLNVIVAPEVVTKFKDLKSPASAIGMGPFAVESFEPNVQVTLARRADSWMGDRPWVDKVKYINILDTAAGVAAYRAGQVHTMTVPPDQVDQFKRDLKNHTFQTRGGISRGSFTLRMDGKVPWGTDVRVRQALSLAVDRQEAIEVVYSGRGKPVATIPWVFEGFAIPQDQLGGLLGYKKDKNAERAEATKLLQAAGQEKLSFDILSSSTNPTPHMAAAQLVQDNLKKIGVTVKLDLIEFTSYKKRVDDGNWVTTTDGFSSGFNPDEHLRQYAYTKGSRNYGGYSNKEYDALVDKADAEFDPKKRGEIMQQAQKITINEVSHVWLGCGEGVAVSQPSVKNYIPTGEFPQTWRWDKLWLEA
jgi:peptide/nickel transport system substrate-binding protein